MSIGGRILSLLQEAEGSDGLARSGINLDGLAAKALDRGRLPAIT